MRVYRNCSNVNDYDTQENTIINKFVEKEYKKRDLLAMKEKVKKMNRNLKTEDVPKNLKKKKKHIDVALLTGYNIQYKALENIIKKHWPIL